MAGIYIHIPFCKSRCIYCGFYSTTLKTMQDRYTDALCREMDIRTEDLSATTASSESSVIKTIYLGGGTPSQLTHENLRRLMSHVKRVYNVDRNAEITMECNPDDITEEYAAVISSCGINRVSMGAQTFSDERLRFIRRRHTAAQVDGAVSILRDAGIRNISIDLMFGFPGETADEWRNDISHALNLDVEHISAYSLMFEEGTPLYDMLAEGKVQEIDEDASLAMYNELIDRLTEAGYEHYEISNFARPGRRSRHNSSYWHDVPYTGIGAAAHSYDRVSRQWNVENINEYIDSIGRGILPTEREELDKPTRFNDMVTTALRTCEGISIEKLMTDFGDEYHEYISKGAEKFVRQGLLEITGKHIRLTRKGIFISDTIMSELMRV